MTTHVKQQQRSMARRLCPLGKGEKDRGKSHVEVYKQNSFKEVRRISEQEQSSFSHVRMWLA